MDEVEWTWLGCSSALRFLSRAIRGNIRYRLLLSGKVGCDELIGTIGTRIGTTVGDLRKASTNTVNMHRFVNGKILNKCHINLKFIHYLYLENFSV